MLGRVAIQQAELTTAVVVPRGVHEDLDAERVAALGARLQVVSQHVPLTVGEVVLTHQLPVDPQRCGLGEGDFRRLPRRDGKYLCVGRQVRDDVDVTPLEGPLAPLLDREQSSPILLELGADVVDGIYDRRLEGPRVRVGDPSVDREDVQQAEIRSPPVRIAP